MKRFFAALFIVMSLGGSLAFADNPANWDTGGNGAATADQVEAEPSQQALSDLEAKRDAYADFLNSPYLDDNQKKEVSNNLEVFDGLIQEIKNNPNDYNTNLDRANESSDVLDGEIQKMNDVISSARSSAAKSRGTVLPSTEFSLGQCSDLMNYVDQYSTKFKQFFRNQDSSLFSVVDGFGEFTVSDVLACAIKTGDIKLWMVPYYVKFALEFVLTIAGILAVAGLVFGGYLYLFSGISDAKEQGKKAILYAIVGYVMALLAWALVNIVIGILTAF